MSETKGVKIVTIGGGSSYTPELMQGFIKRYDTLPIREIWLVDIEDGKEKLEIAKKLKSMDIDIQTIVESTGLTKEEIEKL